MTTTIKGEHSIPAGQYHAVWSGWKVRLGNAEYDVTAGIRGTAAAIITVDAKGNATVEIK